jgi:beta-aspartyl-peptidase (threonine type)
MESNSRFGLIVHGGAGSLQRGLKKDIDLRRKILRKSASEGYAILRKGGAALDAVEASVIVLEDSGVFNAGRGSCTTIEGNLEPDAAVMLGDLSCGAVAGASMVRNPIKLARACMEKTDHVFLAGAEPLRKFAVSIGFEIENLQPTPARIEQYKEYLGKMRSGKLIEWPKNSALLPSYVQEKNFGDLDTIGSVAIDSEGNVCAGVSTGGRFMKLPGRVGDSPIPGAGLYADNNSGAACATGAGEEIIRVSLCKTVCDFMRNGLDAQSACDASISLLSRLRGIGVGGVIAVDTRGDFGLARNTEMMPVSICFSNMEKLLAVVLPEEYGAITALNKRGNRKLKM